jgi:hypothetical protein
MISPPSSKTSMDEAPGLIASAGQDLPLSKARHAAAKVLDDGDVAALFGLETAETAAGSDTPRQRPGSPGGPGQ